VDALACRRCAAPLRRPRRRPAPRAARGERPVRSGWSVCSASVRSGAVPRAVRASALYELRACVLYDM